VGTVLFHIFSMLEGGPGMFKQLYCRTLWTAMLW
jgi:hypothetical protein